MTLVFLHPVGLDGRCWQFLPDELLRDAVLYDMLWHGGRPKPAIAPDLSAFADDVVEHVEGPLDVVGLSMGGSVALHVALRHPDRVRSLVVVAASAGGGRPEVLEERARAVEQGGMAAVLDPTLERWFSPEVLAEPDHPGVSYVRDRLMSDDPEAFAAAWRALAANEVRHRLSEVGVPVSVVHAASDAAGGVEPKRQMAAAIPRSRLVVIEGPHMVQLERPRELGEAVSDHLRWASS